MKVRQVVAFGTDYLSDAGINESANDSFELFSFVTGMSRTDYLIHGADEVSEDDYNHFMALIKRRAMHEPLQHITENAYFFKRCFYVNKDVLIPRFDTEVLVEEALKVIKQKDSVLDMCTGSGIIIITLALECENISADAADISAAALTVARKNAENLGADVTFVESDLFSNSDIGMYNVIVSNPPYIRSEQIEGLDAEVKNYDPITALDGGEDGLYFYDVISKEAAGHIYPGGFLIFEIGCDQAEDVSGLMSQAGFTDIKVVKDLAGLDRVVIGRL